MHSSKKNYYSAFGLNISSEITLPELLTGNSTSIDVEIETGCVPDSLDNIVKKGLRFQASKNKFILNVDDVADYYITDGNKIIIDINNPDDMDSVRLFLLGSAFGALLIQRGIFPLHGSSVNYNGQALAFTGISGVGKSTLAVAFLKKGYKILDDDVSAIRVIDNKPHIGPGYPQIKLWADVIRKMNNNPEDYKKLRKNIEKHGIDIRDQFNSSMVPLRYIFILSVKNTEGFEIQKLSGTEKFNALRRNTYRFQFIEGLEQQINHFKNITNLSQHTEIFRISRPRKDFLLDELVQTIIKQIESV